MSYRGKFVWYELMTTDLKAAEDFYVKAVGWSARDAGLAEMRYTLFSAGDSMVAGMMELPDSVRAGGGRPGWMGYVAVDDVDAGARQVTQNGGAVHRTPTDIPGIGRFAVVGDPQGAVIVLFRGTSEPPPQSAARGAPGHGGWHELLAGDQATVFPFYAGLFGWTKGEHVDMGSMGIYQLFVADGETIGGMMTKPASVPTPFWTYYFNVQSIEAAATRVRDAGGQVIRGPHEVPGGSWIVQCLDPQGAVFALLEPPRADRA